VWAKKLTLISDSHEADFAGSNEHYLQLQCWVWQLIAFWNQSVIDKVVRSKIG